MYKLNSCNMAKLHISSQLSRELSHSAQRFLHANLIAANLIKKTQCCKREKQSMTVKDIFWLGVDKRLSVSTCTLYAPF